MFCINLKEILQVIQKLTHVHTYKIKKTKHCYYDSESCPRAVLWYVSKKIYIWQYW